MSVLEEVRDIERRIATRLAELQPLVDEYQELHRVAERMGLDVTPPQQSATGSTPRTRRRPAPSRQSKTAAPRKRPAKAAGSTRRRAGGTQATGRERRQRVIDLITEQPGITVRELSARLGVDPPPLYRVVRKLQSEGVIKKDGVQLQLAS